MKLAVINEYGKELRQLEVDDSVFGIEPNMAVLHQAYVTQRNNNRTGNHKTKSRGEVQGSTRKMRMQKYTGRARAGSNRAPTRVGGGVAFGPRPRSYARDLPKKMRRLAIRSALSGKVADGQLVIIDQLALETPKTKEIIKILAAAGFERSALLVTGSPDKAVTASVRNLERTKALPAAYLNVLDMLNHAGVLMTEDAVRVAEGLWGQHAGEPRAARRHSITIAVPKPAGPLRGRAKSRAEDAAAAVIAAEETAAAAAVVAAEKAKAPKAKASDAEAPTAEKPAEGADEAAKAKRTQAPKAEKAAEEAPAAEASTEEAPKPKRERAPKAEKPADEAPAAEASAEEAPKPKRTRAPKAEASTEKPAEGAEEAPKPKRAPREKKTKGTE